MAYAIVKTLTVTRVSYQTVVVEDGTPRFVEHPDAVFRGILSQERVAKLLKDRLGKDSLVVITKVDAGTYKFKMGLEEFVLHAQITTESETAEEPISSEDEEPSLDASSTDTDEVQVGVADPTCERPSDSGTSETSDEDTELTEEDKRRFAPPSWW